VEANRFDDLYFLTGQKMCEHVECTPGCGRVFICERSIGHSGEHDRVLVLLARMSAAQKAILDAIVRE
jgi:hypothetical protein